MPTVSDLTILDTVGTLTPLQQLQVEAYLVGTRKDGGTPVSSPGALWTAAAAAGYSALSTQQCRGIINACDAVGVAGIPEDVLEAGLFPGNDWAAQINAAIASIEVAGTPTEIRIGVGIKLGTTASAPIILPPYCGLRFTMPGVWKLGAHYIELDMSSFIIGVPQRAYRTDADGTTATKGGTNFLADVQTDNAASDSACIVTKAGVHTIFNVLENFSLSRDAQLSCTATRKGIYLRSANSPRVRNVAVSLFRDLAQPTYGVGFLWEVRGTGQNSAWGKFENLSVGDCGVGLRLDNQYSIDQTVGYSVFHGLNINSCATGIDLNGSINNYFSSVTMQGDRGAASTNIRIVKTGGQGGGAINNHFEYVDGDALGATTNVYIENDSPGGAASNWINMTGSPTIGGTSGYSPLNTFYRFQRSLVAATDSIADLTPGASGIASSVKAYIGRSLPAGLGACLRIGGNGLTDTNALQFGVETNGNVLIRYNNATKLALGGNYLDMPVGSLAALGTGAGRVSGVIKVLSTAANGSAAGAEQGIVTAYAGAQNADGETIKVQWNGTIVNSAATKRIQLYWGGTGGQLLADTTAALTSIGAVWEAECTVTRRGGSAQILSGYLMVTNTSTNAVTTRIPFCVAGTRPHSSDQTLSVKLTTPTADTDVTFQHAVAEWFPAK